LISQKIIAQRALAFAKAQAEESDAGEVDTDNSEVQRRESGACSDVWLSEEGRFCNFAEYVTLVRIHEHGVPCRD
jgi:hypothetical protein